MAALRRLARPALIHRVNNDHPSAGPRLLGPADVRLLAERYDVRPTKRRGQNFVIDANTVRRIVAAADLRPDDRVLEVGPGLGSLTLGPARRGGQCGGGRDRRSDWPRGSPATVAEFAPDHERRLDVVEADAMQIESLPGEPPTALVANLPYNVAVPVLLHLLETFDSIERVLVMVQLEVADRLAAEPGSRVYGVPSVKAAWYADVRRAGVIGRNVFWPAPNVDSGLVAMTRREPPASRVGRERVFEVVDAAFAQRRKMMRAALSGLVGSSAEAAERDRRRRPRPDGAR